MKKQQIIRCVYRIDNPYTGDFYIGSTDNFRKRKNHWRDWKNSVSNPRMKNDFKKYGIDNFKFSILEKFEHGESKEFRLQRELEYIHSLNPSYNTIGKPRDEKTKEKIRKKLEGVKQSPEVVEKRRLSIIKRYENKPRNCEYNKKNILVDGIGIKGVNEACKIIGCSYGSIKKALERGTNRVKGHSVYYEARKNRVKDTIKKAMIIDGREYKGLREVSKVVGMSKVVIWRYLREGRYLINGHVVYGKEDKDLVPSREKLEELEEKRRQLMRQHKQKTKLRKEVIVDGIKYMGLKAASKALGCGINTIVRAVELHNGEWRGHNIVYFIKKKREL